MDKSTNFEKWNEYNQGAFAFGKDIAGKPRLSLVPPELIRAVGRVRTYGAEKYGADENWKGVDPAYYRDALMRHLTEYLENPDSTDPESGLHHMEHIACNAAFLLELDKERRAHG